MRTEEHQVWSDFGKKPYLVGDAQSLLEMYEKMANRYLIFLQFVDSIGLYEWDPGRLNWQQKVQVKRKIASFDPFVSFPTRVLCNSYLNDNYTYSYKLAITEKKYPKVFLRSYSSQNFSWEIFVTVSQLDRRLVGGIAFQNSDTVVVNTSCEASAPLFCFLPLPLPEDTGLPFLVNGNFAVSCSRRQLDIETGDDKSEEKSINAQWNQRILNEAVLKSLLITLLAKTPEQQKLFSLFPKPPGTLVPDVRSLVDKFYKCLIENSDVKIFESINKMGRFALCDQNVTFLPIIADENFRQSVIACLRATSTEKTWISLPSEIHKYLVESCRSFMMQKTANLESLAILILQQATLFMADLKSDYLAVLHYAIDLDFSQAVTNCLKNYRCFWVNNEHQIQMKYVHELILPSAEISKMLYFTRLYFPADEMELSARHLNKCVNTLGMHKKTLTTKAVEDIVNQLKKQVDIAEAKRIFETFVTHIEQRQNLYKNDVVCYLKKNLFIPLTSEAGNFHKQF